MLQWQLISDNNKKTEFQSYLYHKLSRDFALTPLTFIKLRHCFKRQRDWQPATPGYNVCFTGVANEQNKHT